MFKAVAKILAVTSAVAMATPSFALVDGQALYGMRSGDFKTDGADSQKLSGNEMSVAAHVDPIPLVPIAFGASFHLITWDHKKLEAKSAEATMANLEIMAWIPGVPIITPYAKIGYTVLGAMHVKQDLALGASTVEVDALYKVSGYNLTVGVNYPVVPFIGILAEVDMGNHTVKADKNKQAGIEITTTGESKASTTAFRVGIQVGL